MYSAKFEETDFELSLLSISDASNKYYTGYIFNNLVSYCKKSDNLLTFCTADWRLSNQIIIKQYLLSKFATGGMSTKRGIDKCAESVLRCPLLLNNVDWCLIMVSLNIYWILYITKLSKLRHVNYFIIYVCTY